MSEYSAPVGLFGFITAMYLVLGVIFLRISSTSGSQSQDSSALYETGLPPKNLVNSL